MNDPHVNALRYEFIIGKDLDYDKAPPIEKETDDFVFSLSPKETIFKMKTHFATEKEAQKITDEFLKVYRIYWGLQYPSDNINFLFKSSEIIDRAPDNNTSSICVNDTINLKCSTDVHVSRSKFPSPPKNFVASPDVETIYLRFKLALQGCENLLPMAYMCLTVIEISAGSRGAAAKKYNIDMKVLSKWGELVSTKGSVTEARKAPQNSAFDPLHQEEREWIIQLIKKVILRLGNYEYNPSQIFDKISLDDLPTI